MSKMKNHLALSHHMIDITKGVKSCALGMLNIDGGHNSNWSEIFAWWLSTAMALENLCFVPSKNMDSL